MEVVVHGETSNSSSSLSLDQLISMDPAVVPDTDAKFAGCKGCSVKALLGAAKSGSLGVFVAGDGMLTDPIAFDILVRGIMLHTDSDGKPLTRGGPLRLWFPEDAGLRCSSGNNLAVKDVRRMELTLPGSP